MSGQRLKTIITCRNLKFTSHFFKDGDYNTDTLSAQFMTIQEEQILLMVIEIHKKNGGDGEYFRDNRVCARRPYWRTETIQ